MATSVFDIIVMTESRLGNDINDNELRLTDFYAIYRTDRANTLNPRVRGGGMAIIIRGNIESEEVNF